MDITHKTEFKVRDLGTAAVTLFPSRAQITREIKGIDLKVSKHLAPIRRGTFSSLITS